MLKNITLSAEATVIQRARKKANNENTTLNQQFREWLRNYLHSEEKPNHYDAFMKRMDGIKPGKKFSRDEMNER